MNSETYVPGSGSAIRSSFILLLAALIWGTAFVAQSVGMEHVQPFTFSMTRFLIGFIVLLPVAAARKRSGAGGAGRTADPVSKAEGKKLLIKAGLCCGLFLCAASNFQQFAIKYTTVGKAGFITACYIVAVPVLGLFLGKKCGPFIWLAVGLAVAGLYLLCITDGFSIGSGDLLALVCSILFAMQILSVDHFAPLVDSVQLSAAQFLVCALISAVPALVLEKPAPADILAAWQPLMYVGVLSCGVAYTCQIIGQKGLNPTVASLIMSLESSISVIAGWLFLGQRMGSREILGCVVMFAAIVLAQLPEKRRKTRIPDERSRSARLRLGREW